MADRTRDALEIIDKVIGDDDELRALVDEEVVNAEVAHLIHVARKRAGLTQRELAERIGTGQPTIARLEDADYAGHSLTMLRRIAAALGQRIEIRFLSAVDLAEQ
ncbi:MAG: helix-turn-helix transcriptional regulator [Planctomycetota bacterium]|jgi:predicted transcriptional regulator